LDPTVHVCAGLRNVGGRGQGNNNKQPCRNFKAGRCKFGANCRFSHAAAASQPGGGWGQQQPQQQPASTWGNAGAGAAQGGGWGAQQGQQQPVAFQSQQAGANPAPWGQQPAAQNQWQQPGMNAAQQPNQFQQQPSTSWGQQPGLPAQPWGQAQAQAPNANMFGNNRPAAGPAMSIAPSSDVVVNDAAAEVAKVRCILLFPRATSR